MQDRNSPSCSPHASDDEGDDDPSAVLEEAPKLELPVVIQLDTTMVDGNHAITLAAGGGSSEVGDTEVI